MAGDLVGDMEGEEADIERCADNDTKMGALSSEYFNSQGKGMEEHADFRQLIPKIIIDLL